MTEDIACGQDTCHSEDICGGIQDDHESSRSYAKSNDVQDVKNAHPQISFGSLLSSFKSFISIADEFVSLRWCAELSSPHAFPNGDKRIFGLTSLLTEPVQVEGLFALPIEGVEPKESYTQRKQPHSDGGRLFTHFSDASRSITSGDAKTIFDVAIRTSVPYSTYNEWEDTLRLQVQRLMEASLSLEKELLLYRHFSEERSVVTSEWERRVSETLCQLKLHVMLTFLKRLQCVLKGVSTQQKSLVHSLPLYLYSPPLFMVSPLCVTNMPVARAKYGLLYAQNKLNVRSMRSTESFVGTLGSCLKLELLPFLLRSSEEQPAWQPQRTKSDMTLNFSAPLCELGEAAEGVLNMLREAWDEVQADLHRQLAKPSDSTNHAAVGAMFDILKLDSCNGDGDGDMAIYQVQYAFPLLTGGSSGDPNSFFPYAAPIQLDLTDFQRQLIAKLHTQRQDRYRAYFHTESNSTSGATNGKQPKVPCSDSVGQAKDPQVSSIPAARWDSMCHDAGVGRMAEELRKTFYQDRPIAPRIESSAEKRPLFCFNSSNRRSHAVEQIPFGTSPKQDVVPSQIFRQNDFEVEPTRSAKQRILTSPLGSSELLPALSGVKNHTGSASTRSTASRSTRVTSSRPVSGAPLPYIKPEEISKLSELPNMRFTPAISVNELSQDERSSPNDNRKLSSTPPDREAERTVPIVTSDLLNSSLPYELGLLKPLWKAVLEICPTLSEEILPGIYLQDLHDDIQKYPRVLSVLKELSTKCSESSKQEISNTNSGVKQPEQMLLELLRSIASDMRARTLSIQTEMPFLPYRVDSILLCNLKPQMEQDAPFQSLRSIRHQIIRGAIGIASGIGYTQRLDRVEQCLRDAASPLARTSGFPMISEEKAEASIAILSQIQRNTSDVTVRDERSNGTPSESTLNGVTSKRYPLWKHSKTHAHHSMLGSPHSVAFPAALREAKAVGRRELEPSTTSNTIGGSPGRDHPPSVDYTSSSTARRLLFPEQQFKTSITMKNTFSLPLMSQQDTAQTKKKGQQRPLQPNVIPSYAESAKRHPVNYDAAIHWSNHTSSESVSREGSGNRGGTLNTLKGDAPMLAPDQSNATAATAAMEPTEHAVAGWAQRFGSRNVSLKAAISPALTERTTHMQIPPVTAKTRILNLNPMKELSPLDLGRGNAQSAAGDSSTASTSLREVYQQACLEHKMRPNTGLLYLLPAEPFKRLASLDLSANYVGSKGVIPLLEAIKHNGDALRTLRLSHNNLENMEVMEVVNVLLNTPAGDALTYLDLSYNPISRTSGQVILDLCIKRSNITTICLEGTMIPRQMIKSIIDTVGKSAM